MRYRRLGRTDLMVSEVGLEVRDALGDAVGDALGEAGPEAEERAIATLRAAIDRGITVFAWDVSDAAEDVEPLLVRAAGVDRGRLTLVAVLDDLPAAEDIGPQVEAIASRLAEPDAAGYLDVIALPGLPDAAQSAALEEVRRLGVARFVAYAGAEADVTGSPIVDCLVLDEGPTSEHDDIGVIVRTAEPEARPLSGLQGVSCVVTCAHDASEVAGLLAPAV